VIRSGSRVWDWPRSGWLIIQCVGETLTYPMYTIAVLLLLSYSSTFAAEGLPQQRIPAIDCPADDQTEPEKSAGSEPTPVQVEPRLADQLAYYGSARRLGVFAPKGWSCRAWSGANGSFLVVTPKHLAPPYYPLPNIGGPAVTINSWDGGGPGRFHVAIIAAQLFSLVGSEFIAHVRQEHLIPDSSFGVTRYAEDDVKYLSDRLVEFSTPANHPGIGSDDMLEVSAAPIRGLMILNLENEVDTLTELRIRLPPNLNSLAEAILQLQATCMQSQKTCRGAQAAAKTSD
jgi:hypothetical protein